MSDWITGGLLAFCCLIGVGLTALRLPGTWWILATGVVYAWTQDWRNGMTLMLSLLGGAAVVGEIVEFVASVVLTRQAGASRWAGWGAVAGGILGAIFLSFVVPIPFVGTIVGAMLGCFLGAGVVEWSDRRRMDQSARVGFFAALGFAVGLVVKIAIAVAMAIVLVQTWRTAPQVA